MSAAELRDAGKRPKVSTLLTHHIFSTRYGAITYESHNTRSGASGTHRKVRTLLAPLPIHLTPPHFRNRYVRQQQCRGQHGPAPDAIVPPPMPLPTPTNDDRRAGCRNVLRTTAVDDLQPLRIVGLALRALHDSSSRLEARSSWLRGSRLKPEDRPHCPPRARYADAVSLNTQLRHKTRQRQSIAAAPATTTRPVSLASPRYAAFQASPRTRPATTRSVPSHTSRTTPRAPCS